MKKLGENVELEVTMSEDEYEDARTFFEEIISSQKPIKGRFLVMLNYRKIAEIHLMIQFRV